MRNRNLVVLAVVFFALVAIPAAYGGAFIIGGTDANNVFPFGEYDTNGRYQQFYAGLPAGFEITDISFRTLDFFFFPPGPTYTMDVTLGLATARAQSTSFGSNLGLDYRLVFNGPLTFTPGTGRDANGFDLKFHLLNPFAISGANQTIVLDVMVNENLDTFTVFAAGFDDPRSSRVYQSFGQGPVWQDGLSLQTEFNTTPEPAPWTMMVGGLGLVGLRFVPRRPISRRRR